MIPFSFTEAPPSSVLILLVIFEAFVLKFKLTFFVAEEDFKGCDSGNTLNFRHGPVGALTISLINIPSCRLHVFNC